MTINKIDNNQDIISKKIKDIPPDFFKQLPSQYQFLNNLHYLKNVKINISDKRIMLFDKNGNDIGRVNFYLVKKVPFDYYKVNYIGVKKEYSGKNYGTLLIELLDYFLRKKSFIGILINVAISNGDDAYRIEDKQLGNALNDLYKRHGWVEIDDGNLIYNASNQKVDDLIEEYLKYNSSEGDKRDLEKLSDLNLFQI